MEREHGPSALPTAIALNDLGIHLYAQCSGSTNSEKAAKLLTRAADLYCGFRHYDMAIDCISHSILAFIGAEQLDKDVLDYSLTQATRALEGGQGRITPIQLDNLATSLFNAASKLNEQGAYWKDVKRYADESLRIFQIAQEVHLIKPSDRLCGPEFRDAVNRFLSKLQHSRRKGRRG